MVQLGEDRVAMARVANFRIWAFDLAAVACLGSWETARPQVFWMDEREEASWEYSSTAGLLTDLNRIGNHPDLTDLAASIPIQTWLPGDRSLKGLWFGAGGMGFQHRIKAWEAAGEAEPGIIEWNLHPVQPVMAFLQLWIPRRRL
jgi:hypothetical protein